MSQHDTAASLHVKPAGRVLIAHLTGHPYLVATLVGMAIVILAWLLAGPQRGPMLWAGVIELLHVPFSPLFDRVYWSPARTGGLPVGVEDVLVCFMLGAGVWFAAAFPWRNRIQGSTTSRRAALRLTLVATGPVLPVMWLRFGLGLTVMETLILGMIGLAFVLIALQPGLLRLSLTGLLLYLPYYLGFMVLCHALIPGFAGIWDGPELWGLRIFGVPLDEIAWATAFALCYPAVVATVLGLRVHVPRPASITQ